jgi:hypothetical protein
VKRQILGSDTKSESQSLFSVTPKASSSLTKSQIQKLLRQKRSPAYMEALHQLDAGGHISETEALNKLIETIKSELPDISNLLLGIVAKCYLGHPFEVHTLQIMGSIVHRYKVGEPLPAALEKARSMALHSSYEYIEVYSNYIVTVSSNGSTSLVTVEGEDNNG